METIFCLGGSAQRSDGVVGYHIRFTWIRERPRVRTSFGLLLLGLSTRAGDREPPLTIGWVPYCIPRVLLAQVYGPAGAPWAGLL